jgi:hypothetical protein
MRECAKRCRCISDGARHLLLFLIERPDVLEQTGLAIHWPPGACRHAYGAIPLCQALAEIDSTESQ